MAFFSASTFGWSTDDCQRVNVATCGSAATRSDPGRPSVSIAFSAGESTMRNASTWLWLPYITSNMRVACAFVSTLRGVLNLARPTASTTSPRIFVWALMSATGTLASSS